MIHVHAEAERNTKNAAEDRKRDMRFLDCDMEGEKIMVLSETDGQFFYQLWFPLLGYASCACGLVETPSELVTPRGVDAIIAERARVFAALEELDGVEPFPSDSNYILFRIDDAAGVWQRLYDASVLVRDFSSSKYLKNCLRVSVGSREENDRFLAALAAVMRG